MTKPTIASFLTLRHAHGIVLGLIAALGTFLVLYATPQGLGLSDDSIAYIAGARSILNGEGYREAWLASNGPVTHFPPGFSSILALIGLSGLDPLRGTRFVNSLLFGANIFLTGLIAWRMTQSKIAGIVSATLLLVNYSLFRVHSVAMSEPLYIFFTLASFLTFYFYFQYKQKRWLILTGCLVGMAYLTRYAGLALFSTFLVTLILLKETWQRRLSRSAIFIASTIPWILAWSIRNRLLTDNATNRTLIYHPITTENIDILFYNISIFLMPIETWQRFFIRTAPLLSIITSVIVVPLLIWLVNKALRKFLKPQTETPELLSFVSTLYIFGYLSSVILSMTFFDASTKFQLRILSPVYISLLIIFVYFLHWLWNKQKHITIFIIICAFSLSVYGMNDTVAQLHRGGQGYASFQWYDSEAMDFLSALPKDTRIYTNQPGAVYLYTDRPSYVLPDLIDPVTGLPRAGYEKGVALLHEEVLAGNAVLALFKFGSEAEDVQTIYIQLSDGLFLAHDTHGDKIYSAYP